MTKRAVVCGSRTLHDKDFVFAALSRFLKDTNGLTVLSGTAMGADQLGEKWAEENGIPVEQFPAEWDLLGKKAGIIRNEEMINTATHVIAFWDGQSKGAKHAIDYTKGKGLPLIVVEYKVRAVAVNVTRFPLPSGSDAP